jgi:hypothetical protein
MSSGVETSLTIRIFRRNLKWLEQADQSRTSFRAYDPHLPLLDFLSLARERSEVRVEPSHKLMAA